MTGAERQKRYRKRAMAGDVVVRLPVDVDLVEWLISTGRLARSRDGDREAIAAAIRAALAERVTRHARQSQDRASSPV